METNNLYKIAEQNDIPINCFPLPLVKSLALNNDGVCAIALDPTVFTSGARERVCLAHEIGHCKTDAFYESGSDKINRLDCEEKADKWAILHLVPLEKLSLKLKEGYEDVPTLADFFEVTEEFMEKAIKFYLNFGQCY